MVSSGGRSIVAAERRDEEAHRRQEGHRDLRMRRRRVGKARVAALSRRLNAATRATPVITAL